MKEILNLYHLQKKVVKLESEASVAAVEEEVAEEEEEPVVEEEVCG